jgi:hypothetical protein
MSPTSDDRSAAPSPEEAYATTYYPGTTDMGSAGRVDAAAGAVVENINLQLSKSPAVRVRGSVVNQSGTTVPAIYINMARTGDVASYAMNSMGASAPQGQFEFRGVTSGRYVLTASASEGQKRFQGRQVVDVGSTNVENVSIALGTGFDLSGKVRVEGQAQVGAQMTFVILQPADSVGGGLSSQSARADTEGNFTFTGIWPGRYVLRVWPGPANLYVKSQRLGSEDVMEAPLDLTGGAGGALSIVLGTGTGEVSGAVTSADGTPVVSAMVVLIPESAARRELQQFHRMAPAEAGAYQLTGVPPGRYKLFAWESIPTFAWMDPDVLKPVESKGKAIEIQESSKDTVDLRALPAVE